MQHVREFFSSSVFLRALIDPCVPTSRSASRSIDGSTQTHRRSRSGGVRPLASTGGQPERHVQRRPLTCEQPEYTWGRSGNAAPSKPHLHATGLQTPYRTGHVSREKPKYTRCYRRVAGMDRSSQPWLRAVRLSMLLVPAEGCNSGRHCVSGLSCLANGSGCHSGQVWHRCVSPRSHVDASL